MSAGAHHKVEQAAERLLPLIWQGEVEALNALVIETRVQLAALLPPEARRDLEPALWVGEVERAIVEAAALATHETCHFSCLVRKRLIARNMHRMLCSQALLAALGQVQG